MNTEKLRMQAATEALVKAGTGMCSRETFAHMASLMHPAPAKGDLIDARFCGLRLILSDFVPPGEIWPVPKMSLEIPLKPFTGV